MQSYRFTQAVKINDKVFGLGIHSVPEEIEHSEQFLHFVRCGWISDAPPPMVAAQPVAVSEQAKKLAERIEKKLAANKPSAPRPLTPPALVPKPEVLKQEGWEPKAAEGGEGPKPLAPPVDETHSDDDGGNAPEETLTPQQKAARTRKLNAEKKAQGA